MLQSINPANGEMIGEYSPLNISECEPLIQKAHRAHQIWRTTSLQERSNILNDIAAVLDSQESELAVLITREMGKPLQESRGEIQKCAWVCRYYAENIADFLAPKSYPSNGQSHICYEPLGLVLAVMPWNFPFWQVFRFAAPAIAAGNGCLLKHASNVSGCALKIQSVLQQAGLPNGVFTSLLLESKNVSHVIAHPHVQAVTLTGSAQAGAAVASEAGRHLKKSVLELGGSDPYIILSDADIELAAKKIIASRMLNCGQSCIGAKRVIVQCDVKEALEKALFSRIKRLITGDPCNPEVDLGPIVSEVARDSVHAQVTATVNAGAQLMIGGELKKGKGFYYPPTLLTNVPENSPAYSDEIFGPVISIISADSETDAIEIANASPFGLGAAVFSKNDDKALAVASKIEAGSCFINDFVKSDPRLPFGGIKESGYGRELSELGLYEFMNIKTVVSS